MFARFGRSWALVKECMGLLMEDHSLLMFPLMSSIAMVVIIISFAIPLIPAFGLAAASGSDKAVSALAYVALFLFYWVQFTIVIFFNTALVEVAMRHFDGQPAGVGEGLRRALARLPMIIGYAFIAATVGTILRMIAERVGLIGKIIIGLMGFAWTVANALVVPVLAAENVGPIDAVKRSAEMIKKTWGEAIIGNAGIGLIFGLFLFLFILVGVVLIIAGFATGHPALGVMMLLAVVVSVVLLVLAQSTLHGLYAAALYRYANGLPTRGIDPALLANAFAPRP